MTEGFFVAADWVVRPRWRTAPRAVVVGNSVFAANAADQFRKYGWDVCILTAPKTSRCRRAGEEAECRSASFPDGRRERAFDRGQAEEGQTEVEGGPGR